MKSFIIKIFAAVMVFSAGFASMPPENPCSVVNAAEEDKLTVAVYAMTGTLYYYDTPSGNIVLNDVSPVGISSNTDNDKKPGDDAAAVAAAVKYAEIPTAEGGRFFKDGSHAANEWINNYVDRQIWFIAAVAADGSVTIPYFKIIV